MSDLDRLCQALIRNVEEHGLPNRFFCRELSGLDVRLGMTYGRLGKRSRAEINARLKEFFGSRVEVDSYDKGAFHVVDRLGTYDCDDVKDWGPNDDR